MCGLAVCSSVHQIGAPRSCPGVIFRCDQCCTLLHCALGSVGTTTLPGSSVPSPGGLCSAGSWHDYLGHLWYCTETLRGFATDPPTLASGIADPVVPIMKTWLTAVNPKRLPASKGLGSTRNELALQPQRFINKPAIRSFPPRPTITLCSIGFVP